MRGPTTPASGKDAPVDRPLSDVSRGGDQARVTGRIGVVAAGTVHPRWAVDAVELSRRAGVELAFAAIRRAPPKASPEPGGLAARLYAAVDRRIFARRGDALRRARLDRALDGVPRLDLADASTDDVLRLTDAERAWIRENGADAILLLGFAGLAAAGDESLAPLGVWRIDVTSDAPLATVLRRRPTVSSLRRLGPPGDPGTVVYRSISGTDPLSAHRNSVAAAAKAAHFPVRALARRGRPAAVAPAREAGAVRAASAPLSDRPLRTAEAAILGASAVARFAGRRLRRLVLPGQWLLGWTRLGSLEDAVRGIAPAGLRALLPPEGLSWADPFPVHVDGRQLVFFEEWVPERRKGHIVVAELDPAGRLAERVPVLDLPHHLSYPCVFRWRDDWFLVPESSASRTTIVYGARRFPTDWEPAGTLLEGERLLDATPVEIGGRWWLFAAMPAGPAARADELHVFHAASPLGPWHPHPLNPVNADAGSARPAGRPFALDGTWYRPAQDGLPRYGAAIVINRIERLDEETYEESTVGRIGPTWRRGLLATHTLNAADGLIVVDGEVGRIGRRSG